MAALDTSHPPARRLAGLVVIRIVVTGSECCGKTTLVEAIAEHYGTDWVPEFVRTFVRDKGVAPVYEDVEAIARGQIALEDRYADATPKLLLQDTDLLSTLVYSNHYYGDCPAWVEDALANRAADLYVLAGIDVPWVSDGYQRDRGDRREEMHKLFHRALADRHLRTLDVYGTHEQRVDAAVAAIDALMGAEM